MKKNIKSTNSKVLFIFIILVFLQISCSNIFCPNCIDLRSFVVVPEKDFCCGPLELPLNSEDKDKLEFFLKKGGKNSNVNTTTSLEDYEHYAAFIEIISEPYDDDSAFLRDYNLFHKYKNKKRTNKATEFFKRWFRDSIVEDFIDAKEQHKKYPIPLSLMGKNEKYWWVFYKFEKEDVKENENIGEINFKKATKLLVTLRIKRRLKQYK